MLPIQKLCLAAVIAVFSWLPISASATIIVKLDSITPFAGNYDWSFSAIISHTDGLLDNGNVFFTIYDLPGNIVTVEAPADWQAGSSLLGVTPFGLTPTDDGTISNVTFTLDCFPLACNYPGSNTPLIENFVIRLDTNVAAFSEYSWQDYDRYPNTGALLQNGLGTVVDGRVPEPTTLALITLGLAGIGYRTKRKAT